MAKANALNFIDLTGKTFGKLTVVDRAANSATWQTRWNCVCACGNKTVSIGGNLRHGSSKSCGCTSTEKLRLSAKAKVDDLTGRRYGKLLVVNRGENRNNSPYWCCLCDCGNSYGVRTSGLSSGRIISCGCVKNRKPTFEDLTGQRFGRLIAIKRDVTQKYKSTKWFCLCDCGNGKSIVAARLKNSTTTSCGCYAKEQMATRSITHGQSYTVEYRREKAKKQYEADKLDPMRVLKRRVRDMIRAALKRKNLNKTKLTYKILGCSIEDFRLHIEKQFTSGMTWKTIQLDHIIPLATAETEADVYRLNHFSNFQPMFPLLNRDKSDKIGYIVGDDSPENGISFRKIRAQAKLAEEKVQKSLAIPNQVA